MLCRAFTDYINSEPQIPSQIDKKQNGREDKKNRIFLPVHCPARLGCHVKALGQK